MQAGSCSRSRCPSPTALHLINCLRQPCGACWRRSPHSSAILIRIIHIRSAWSPTRQAHSHHVTKVLYRAIDYKRRGVQASSNLLTYRSATPRGGVTQHVDEPHVCCHGRSRVQRGSPRVAARAVDTSTSFCRAPAASRTAVTKWSPMLLSSSKTTAVRLVDRQAVSAV